MSHPDPYGPPDQTPIQVGEVWENPTTREYARILELPYDNPERRVAADTARIGTVAATRYLPECRARRRGLRPGLTRARCWP